MQAGAISAAVMGSDFLISNIGGRVKVISLSHKVLVYFTANPKIRAVLRPGQMVDIAGGATKMPRVTTINLAVLLSTSMLGEAGGLGPFPVRGYRDSCGRRLLVFRALQRAESTS